jgi:hypothetical protein
LPPGGAAWCCSPGRRAGRILRPRGDRRRQGGGGDLTVAPRLTRIGTAELLTRNPQMAEAIARQHPVPRHGLTLGAALADVLLPDAAGRITAQAIGADGRRAWLRGQG